MNNRNTAYSSRSDLRALDAAGHIEILAPRTPAGLLQSAHRSKLRSSMSFAVEFGTCFRAFADLCSYEFLSACSSFEVLAGTAAMTVVLCV